MDRRLHVIVRWGTGAVTSAAVINSMLNSKGRAATAQAPLWFAAGMLCNLSIELADRRDMRRQVIEEVGKLIAGQRAIIDWMSDRLDAYEMHQFGHLLAGQEAKSRDCRLRSINTT